MLPVNCRMTLMTAFVEFEMKRETKPRSTPIGIAMVPEGRRLFPSLTVEENSAARRSHQARRHLEFQMRLRPFSAVIRFAAHARANAVRRTAANGCDRSRVPMSNSRLLLCDELSLGLAPVVIRDNSVSLPSIAAEPTAVILVEQDINRVLDASTRFYCFLEGRLALSEPSKGFDRAAITAAYFGF